MRTMTAGAQGACQRVSARRSDQGLVRMRVHTCDKATPAAFRFVCCPSYRPSVGKTRFAFHQAETR